MHKITFLILSFAFGIYAFIRGDMLFLITGLLFFVLFTLYHKDI